MTLSKVNPLLAVLTLLPLGSCITRGTRGPASSPDIAGGRDVSSAAYPAVVEIKSHFNELSAESCTATWIAPSVLLTAGHCVWRQPPSEGSASTTVGRDFDPNIPFDDSPGGRPRKKINPYRDEIEEAQRAPGSKEITLEKDGKLIAKTSCYLIPDGWGLNSGGPGSRFDLALVIFGDKLNHEVLPMADQGVKVGDEVTMVGFGWNQVMGKDSHILRDGQNKVATVSAEGVIYTFGPTDSKSRSPEKAMVREGDSGGPLIRASQLVGVASALLYAQKKSVCPPPGAPAGPCKDEIVDVGYHVDLSHPQVRPFIQDNLAAIRAGKINPAQSAETCTPREKSVFLQRLRARSAREPR